MDRYKFTTIAHTHHLFCSPLGPEKVDQVLALLQLPAGSRAIDIGCGKGELLIRLVEQYGAAVTGVDTNPHFLTEARQRAAARISAANLTLVEQDIASFPAQASSFDLAVCIGATHAYGNYRGALQAMGRLVKQGGQILLGEGYWQRPPDPAYLSFLEAESGDYTSHAGNIDAGIEAGLTPLYATVSSQDEWDHYEGVYSLGIERYVTTHKDDPDSKAMKERIGRWRQGYLRWGRDTLGFGLYLFQK